MPAQVTRARLLSLYYESDYVGSDVSTEKKRKKEGKSHDDRGGEGRSLDLTSQKPKTIVHTTGTVHGALSLLQHRYVLPSIQDKMP